MRLLCLNLFMQSLIYICAKIDQILNNLITIATKITFWNEMSTKMWATLILLYCVCHNHWPERRHNTQQYSLHNLPFCCVSLTFGRPARVQTTILTSSQSCKKINSISFARRKKTTTTTCSSTLSHAHALCVWVSCLLLRPCCMYINNVRGSTIDVGVYHLSLSLSLSPSIFCSLRLFIFKIKKNEEI